jgi:hypothetical protein
MQMLDNTFSVIEIFIQKYQHLHFFLWESEERALMAQWFCGQGRIEDEASDCATPLEGCIPEWLLNGKFKL